VFADPRRQSSGPPASAFVTASCKRFLHIRNRAPGAWCRRKRGPLPDRDLERVDSAAEGRCSWQL
jgi:hypothetical protein